MDACFSSKETADAFERVMNALQALQEDYHIMEQLFACEREEAQTAGRLWQRAEKFITETGRQEEFEEWIRRNESF